MSDSVHDEHRKRVKNEFFENGFNENTPPHKVIEMLLFYCIPRKDTNIIAHDLLDRFGSISNLIDAPIEQITDVAGAGINTAMFIKLLRTVFRLYTDEKSIKPESYNSLDDVCEYLAKKYLGFTEEVFSVTTFSSNGKMLGFDIINTGNIGEVHASIRDIIELVLKKNATSVIIAHNHPYGVALPSQSDINTTISIKETLKLVNVRLVDHIIICDDDYISMAQSSQFSDIFKV